MIGPRIEGFRTGQRVEIIGGSRVFTGKNGYIVQIAQTDGVYIFTVEVMLRGKPRQVLCRSTELTAL